ncbi:MFS transporter [Paludisphaera borealis]|uniref:Putative sulfoacetate transporter SauU n=1 Tax=Paludisphaera borealis TaxID=1387353 RepID=A0A1U7CJC0_9BACT|nr:MFS transporter [Paludisphaera borealis]APW59031.1 putative sulfoacetate transporter SauU [Paludisphaera borealis]
MSLEAAARPSRVRYRVLGFACSLSMITYLDRACFSTAAPSIAAELGLTDVSQLKWTMTSFAIAYAAFEIPAGAMGDRIGPRAMLMRIVLWWSACTALTGVVGLRVGATALGGLGTLVALRFLFGAGEAGAYPNITRALHNWFPSRSWETAQGLVFMSGRLMGGVTPLIWAILVGGTAASAPLMGWRGAFLLFGLVGVVWAVAFSLWFRDRPDDHPDVNAAERALIGSEPIPTASHANVPWKAILTSRSLCALCIMYCAINYAWAFNMTYLPSYLEERFGVTQGDRVGAIYKGAPLWVGAAGCFLGGVFVNGLARFLGDRRRARQALGVSALSLGAVCWWGAVRAENIHQFSILISLAAFTVDLTLGAAWATCQDLGRAHAAVTAACMNTIGTLGNALAGWLIGALVEQSIVARAKSLDVAVAQFSSADKHFAVLDGYQSAFGTFMFAFILAAACWILIHPKAPLGYDEPSPTVA